jgi:Pyruvate/2-oxoacid:ferredoxin oxidoreductase gamma subunit
VNSLTVSFTQIADGIGDPRVGNIVTLGALMQVAQIVGDEQVDAALAHTVKSARWLELDRKALVAGKQAARQAFQAAAQ